RRPRGPGWVLDDRAVRAPGADPADARGHAHRARGQGDRRDRLRRRNRPAGPGLRRRGRGRGGVAPSPLLHGVDQLVVVVEELDAAIASYRALGFTVTPGGRHPIGTHNALIGLDDGAYLELIAFFEPNAEHRWYRRLRQGGGLVDYCLETNDLSGDVAA